MELSRYHLTMSLILAMLLHGVLAGLLKAPSTEPLPPPSPQPLKVNLLAPVAETSTPIASPPPPPPEQPRPEPARPETPAPPRPEPETIPAAPEPVVTQDEVTPAAESRDTPLPVEAVATEASTIRYEQLVAAWLEQHKQYPRQARRLRIEGEAVLRIVIDRSGQTRQVSLAQRSGNRLLDKAALAMARRANPFPPIPENDPRQELEIVVPVAFMLR